MNGGVMGPGISDLSRHAPPPYFHDHGDLSGVATENSPRSWKRRTQGAFRTWHHIPHRRSSHDPEDLPYPLWKILQDQERRGCRSGFGSVAPCPTGGTAMIAATLHNFRTVRRPDCPVCPCGTYDRPVSGRRGGCWASGRRGTFGSGAPCSTSGTSMTSSGSSRPTGHSRCDSWVRCACRDARPCPHMS